MVSGMRVFAAVINANGICPVGAELFKSLDLAPFGSGPKVISLCPASSHAKRQTDLNAGRASSPVPCRVFASNSGANPPGSAQTGALAHGSMDAPQVGPGGNLRLPARQAEMDLAHRAAVLKPLALLLIEPEHAHCQSRVQRRQKFRDIHASVLVGPEEARRRAVSLGDDPDNTTAGQKVAR